MKVLGGAIVNQIWTIVQDRLFLGLGCTARECPKVGVLHALVSCIKPEI